MLLTHLLYNLNTQIFDPSLFYETDDIVITVKNIETIGVCWLQGKQGRIDITAYSSIYYIHSCDYITTGYCSSVNVV